jgi:hypothetical protein
MFGVVSDFVRVGPVQVMTSARCAHYANNAFVHE